MEQKEKQNHGLNYILATGTKYGQQSKLLIILAKSNTRNTTEIHSGPAVVSYYYQ